MPDNLALAQRLLDAWNQGDAAEVLALVTPEVEIETPGGVDRGLEAARRWVEKQTQPHAVMQIVSEQSWRLAIESWSSPAGRCGGGKPVS